MKIVTLDNNSSKLIESQSVHTWVSQDNDNTVSMNLQVRDGNMYFVKMTDVEAMELINSLHAKITSILIDKNHKLKTVCKTFHVKH